MRTHVAALDDALTMSAFSLRAISLITIPPGGNPLMTISPGLSSIMTIPSGVSPRNMSIMTTIRGFIGAVNAAYEFAEVKTGIVRNFSPTLSRFESRYDLPIGVTRGSGQ